MDRKRLFPKFLLISAITISFLALAGLISVVMVLGYQHDTDPQGYDDYIVKLLGVQESVSYTDPITTTIGIGLPDRGKNWEVETVIEPFQITYWNGRKVTFYAPPHIWEPVNEAYQNFPWCDPRLNISVAFSESSHYTNFKKENAATALGVWQFIRSTWDRLWNFWMPMLFPKVKQMFPNADRTDPRASAFGACVYYRLTGITKAAKGDEATFVREFKSWNNHEEQAKFVYRLYHELLARTGDEDLPVYDVSSTDAQMILNPSEIPWWKKQVIAALEGLGIFPTVAYAYNDDPGGEPPDDGDEPPDDGSTPTCKPLLSRYTIGPRGYHNGCEGTGWTCGAIMGWDYIARDGRPLYAPMAGRIIGKSYDRLGNSVLRIRLANGMILGIMHLHFPKYAVGKRFAAGDQIGTVGNIGISSQSHAHVWLYAGGHNIQNHDLLFCR